MAAAPVTGTLTSVYTSATTGISSVFSPVVAIGPATTGTPVTFTITLDPGLPSGTPFAGYAIIQRSTNGGTNWGAVYLPGWTYASGVNTPAYIQFATGASTGGQIFGFSVSLTETVSGAQYRIVIPAAPSQGTLTYVFSQ